MEKKVRLEKLKEILRRKINPYPTGVERDMTCLEARKNFERLAKEKKEINLVGRIRSIRLHGKACFSHIEDGAGRFQIYLKEDILKEDYNFFKEFIDIGDFIQVKGTLFSTKTGEKTLLVNNFKLITKTLAPLPEKWHGLKEVEIRYRKRYLDLISNLPVREIFRKRGEIIKRIRNFFDQRGFVEVETPILQPIPGGALARPFKTHHHALNLDLYLRIAPELYLKRLLIGGFEKVYEIARCFRNEGIDYQHYPEFTQIEFYQAYSNYKDLMKLTEELFSYLLKEINGSLIVEYENKKLDFTPPYQKIQFREALIKSTGIDLEKTREKKDLEKLASKFIKIERSYTWNKIVDELYKEKVRKNIVQPTFVIDYPIELSPLAKRVENNKNYAQRAQLIVCGIELTNSFTELNDPLEQRKRFEEQKKLREMGDREALQYDKDFLEALEYGLPPCAGEGIGIDRLVAILTNSHSLKEVILFPTLRPK